MLGINDLEGYRALTTLAEKVEFIASQCGLPLVEEEKEEKEKWEDTVVVAGSSSTNRKRKVKQNNVASFFCKKMKVTQVNEEGETVASEIDLKEEGRSL